MAIFKGPKAAHKSGVTLIETIIALLIMGITVTALFSFQSSLIQGIFRSHGLVERIPVLMNIFAQAQQEDWYLSAQKRTVTGPPDVPVSGEYSFKRATTAQLEKLTYLYQERVDAQWASIGGTRKETLTALRFYVPSTDGQEQEGAPS